MMRRDARAHAVPSDRQVPAQIAKFETAINPTQEVIGWNVIVETE